jgi:tripartite-type tricarboxylate transporter receptor subunit TctC
MRLAAGLITVLFAGAALPDKPVRIVVGFAAGGPMMRSPASRR